LQIALEKDLRLQIQMLAAKADLSMKDWILDNILAVERKSGMESYMSEAFGRVVVLAPPSNAERFNLRIDDDPFVAQSVADLAERLQRTKPQIVYTLITCLVNDKIGSLETGQTTPARSLIA